MRLTHTDAIAAVAAAIAFITASAASQAAVQKHLDDALADGAKKDDIINALKAAKDQADADEADLDEKLTALRNIIPAGETVEAHPGDPATTPPPVTLPPVDAPPPADTPPASTPPMEPEVPATGAGDTVVDGKVVHG